MNTPPPANVSAIEPDVRGTTTIRDQLTKHREHAVCASCHKQIDPTGFALEAFDVIGGYRDRYRSIGQGDPAPRGSIDPLIGISFKLGPTVDSTGELSDGRALKDIQQYQTLLTSDSSRLLRNLAHQFVVYWTDRAVRFVDRQQISEIIFRTQAKGGGICTLLHELIGSPLFTGDDKAITRPSDQPKHAPIAQVPQRMMMTAGLPDIAEPVLTKTTTPSATEPPIDFKFTGSHSIDLQVTGLFMPFRVEDFRELIQQFPAAKLSKVDFKTAQATIAYAGDSDLFGGAKPEQIVERLNNRIRQLSAYTLSLKSLSSVPGDKLEFVEIPIVGLDCKACSLATYEILSRVEGVEQATASFRDSSATAWIDPSKTNRKMLEEALKIRGVQLATD